MKLEKNIAALFISAYLLATDLSIVVILLRSLSIIYQDDWWNPSELLILEPIALSIFFFYLVNDFLARVFGQESLKSPNLLQLTSHILELTIKLGGYPLNSLKNCCVRRSVYYVALKPLSRKDWCNEKMVFELAEAIWSYRIVKKMSSRCPIFPSFYADDFLRTIIKHFMIIASRSFHFEQVLSYLADWQILEVEIALIGERAREKPLLFESIRSAQEVANLLQNYVKWDNCNAIQIVDYDPMAIETAIELCKAQYCRQEEFCLIGDRDR
jgi:hypothetical protein